MNKQSMKKIALSLLLAASGAMMGVAAYKFFDKEEPLSFEEKQNVHYASLRAPAASGDGLDFTQAAAIATPAVVHVKITIGENPQADAGGQYNLDPFRDFFGDQDFFFGPRRRGPQMGSGSGVIISPDGYIATNNHVVKGADKIEVVLNDRRSYKAKLIGTDPNTDLALIKIEETNLPFLKYGNSDDVKVGEWVLAVGNPFNLTSTVTAGIVSAKGRNINIIGQDANPNSRIFPIESFIQTDAAVNPGNSGGALVNTRGDLIGINTAIASQTGSYAGYSFAVPVNLVKKVMDDLLKFGEVQRAFLGVEIADVNASLAEEKDLNGTKGVYVAKVNEGGAADQAGIKEGDVIMKIGDVDVNSTSELMEQVAQHRPGDAIEVVLLHNKKEKTVTAVLKNKDLTTTIVKKETYDAAELLGADFDNMTTKEKSGLRIPGGVKVKNIRNGRLKSLGVQDGFIITKINNKAVNTKDEVAEAVNNSNSGMLTVEGIYSNSPNTTRILSFSIR